MSTEDNWNQLRHNIKACGLCEGLNSKELGTDNAPGYGNINSKVVFIGQSLCGKPCIEAQIPFTGGSGKLLDQAFEEASVSKKIFILLMLLSATHQIIVNPKKRK